MKSLYIECNMGAAGDMLCAALYELLENKEAYLTAMNALLPGVTVSAVSEEKCGIQGTRMVVSIHGIEEGCAESGTHAHANTHSHDHSLAHTHEHTHDSMHAHDHEHNHNDTHNHNHAGHLHTHADASPSHINQRIAALPLPEHIRRNALAVYTLLAQAEATVHGRDVEKVHFHEVGELDAIADIVGFCLLYDTLGIEEILVSPIHVGSGMVKTAHGVLPVPAPATAQLLTGVPTYSDSTAGELCTPTGAALLRHFASGFGAMPVISVERIGYGMGKKNFPAANCVRAFLFGRESTNGSNSLAVELRCNVDDMTPEAVGFAMQALLQDGAKDVYVQQVIMKKGRPGYVIVCICDEADADRMAISLFLHTSTIGVRKFTCSRYILERSSDTIETPWGDVRIKRTSGYGIMRAKPEYDDVAKIAQECGLPFMKLYGDIMDLLE